MTLVPGTSVARGGVGGGRRGGGRQQQVEQAVFGVQLGLVFYVFELLFAHQIYGDFDQVADRC